MSKKQRLKKNEFKIEVLRPKKQRVKIKWWVFSLITVTVLLVYINSLNNAFVSDDLPGILRNPLKTKLFASLVGNPFGFAYTIVRYFTALIAHDNPLPYRLVNILFHAGSANLIYVILLGLTGFGTALAAALIFAVHPLLTEGVVWISAAPYSAGTFFGLLAVFFYLKSSSVKTDWKGWLAYLCSLSFAQITISIAPILTVYEILQGTFRKNWKRLVVFYSTAIGFTLVNLAGLNTRITTFVETKGSDLSRPSPLLQAPVAISNYLSLLLWPDKLTLYHSEMSFTVTQIVWFFIVTLLLVSLAVWGWFRDKRVTFWIMWFFLGISITLTPWGVTWIVAERYTYFGLIGLIVTSILIYERLIGKKVPKGVNITILVILLLALGTRTIVRNRDWKSEDSLWLSMEKISPSSDQNHNNLGDLYSRRKEWDKAIEEFKKAVTINPRYSYAFHNLGNAYLYSDRLDEATKYYNKALEINPMIWQTYLQLAVISVKKNDLKSAEEIVLKGIKVNPTTESWRILGVIYVTGNNKEKAIEAFKEALRLDPTNSTARQMLDATY